MYVQKLIAKLTVTVTDTNKDYGGSIMLGKDLMALVGFNEYEMVHVNCTDTGNHWETYIICGDDGVVRLNGAAANHFGMGDRVHILLYGVAEGMHKPKIVVL